MARLLLALGAGFGALTLLFAVSAEARQAGTGPSPPLGCPDAIGRELLLVYDLSGSSLVGQFHTSLVVYDDGLCVISKRNQTTFPIPGQDVDVDSADVGADTVAHLLSQLASLGAFKACDQQMQVVDVPLKTVTVARGSTDARAHTFSYWFDLSGIDATVQSFIQQHFPRF